MTERKLEDIVIVQAEWGAATRELLAGNLEIAEQAERYGEFMIEAFMQGAQGVADLRQQRAWANRLDREAVEQATGGDITTYGMADMHEAIARRLANNGIGYALKAVKSDSRRSILRGSRAHNGRMNQRNNDYAIK